MTENNVITVRLDGKTNSWVKEKASSKNCKVSDIIREAVLAHKEFEELPANMQFSNLMLMQGAKSAMMAYRLLARFVAQTARGGGDIVRTAFNFTNTEFEQFRLGTNNPPEVVQQDN